MKIILWIQIDKTIEMPLIHQVYEQIRKNILQGELTAGERLPSTRELSSNLGISRNVILEAYEQLFTEGYIEGKQGSGTYVAEGATLHLTEKSHTPSFLDMHEAKEETTNLIDFRPGIPSLDMFPRNIWGKISKQICEDTSNSVFGYDSPEGRVELRHILARYLKRTRGVHCHPDQLVITSGATQALSLIADLLLSEGDEVLIEDPITHEIQTIFTTPGSTLYPIPVDEHGIKTDYLPSKKKPSFIFVTPSHQFPIGGTLSIQRRIQLIQYARKVNCFIVEDDYDSEFRYQGGPVHSLQGLDPDKVIYIGTFSKILSPALRLGYLILPLSLAKSCRNLKWFMDLHTPTLQQLTIARFIDEGHLERHIRKMKKIYKSRRDHIKKCLTKEFGKKVKILGDSTGLHLVAEFQNVEFSARIIQELSKKYNVQVYPVELHTIEKGKHKNKIILGYGNLTMKEIEEGINRFKQGIIQLRNG